MAGISEFHRRRVALVLVILGAGLILLGFGVVAFQQVPYEMPSKASHVLTPEAKVELMRQLLFWSLVFVLIFTVSTYAFLRWSRHFRRLILRGPRQATPSEDVWSMHRLPEDWREELVEPPSEPEEPPDQPDEPKS